MIDGDRGGDDSVDPIYIGLVIIVFALNSCNLFSLIMVIRIKCENDRIYIYIYIT